MGNEAAASLALAERAQELLRSVGQRVTKPRVALLCKVLSAGDEHLSAEELLEQVTADNAGVHRATVYRTLEGLTAAGVLCHVHLDRGLTAYHLTNAARGVVESPHLHAQCARCGRIIDLPPHVFGETATRIQEATGFRIDPTHVALSGTCTHCVELGN